MPSVEAAGALGSAGAAGDLPAAMEAGPQALKNLNESVKVFEEFILENGGNPEKGVTNELERLQANATDGASKALDKLKRLKSEVRKYYDVVVNDDPDPRLRIERLVLRRGPR